MSNRITVSARLTPKGAAATAVTKIRASVDWVYPKAYAYLDEDPKNIKPTDEAILTDLAALLVMKGFADESLIEDFKAIDFSGTLEDASYLSDAALIQFTLLRHYYDEVSVSDDSPLDLNLGKFETLTVPDLFILALHLPKYEEVVVTDLYEPHWQHPVLESITLEGMMTALGNVVFNTIAYGATPGAERAHVDAIKRVVSQIGVSGDLFDRVVQYIRDYQSSASPVDSLNSLDTVKGLQTFATTSDEAKAGLLLVRYYFETISVAPPDIPFNAQPFNAFALNGAPSADFVVLHPNKHLFEQPEPIDLFDRVCQYIREYESSNVSPTDGLDPFFIHKGLVNTDSYGEVIGSSTYNRFLLGASVPGATDGEFISLSDYCVAGMVVERSFFDNIAVNPRDIPINSMPLNFAPLGANIGGDRISIILKTITYSSQFNGHALNANAVNGNQFTPA